MSLFRTHSVAYPLPHSHPDVLKVAAALDTPSEALNRILETAHARTGFKHPIEWVGARSTDIATALSNLLPILIPELCRL